jgi:hypothetical protein
MSSKATCDKLANAFVEIVSTPPKNKRFSKQNQPKVRVSVFQKAEINIA